MVKSIGILGGTGAIGQALIGSINKNTYKIFVFTRGESETIDDSIEYVHYNPTKNEWPIEILTQCEVIVNLAGRALDDKRLNKSFKSIVYKSRIDTTKGLVTILNSINHKCNLLINGSAIGIYGYNRSEEILDEDADPGIGFMAELCVDWEKEALKLKGVRTVLLRTGIVLDNENGAFKKLKTPILLGLGSALATGQQWVSWIHINDMIGIIQYVIMNNKIEGIVNAVAPKPVRNIRLIGSISDSLNKAILLPKVPAFVLKLILGELSEALIGGLNVNPRKLKEHNFVWQYNDIDTAVKNLNWKK